VVAEGFESDRLLPGGPVGDGGWWLPATEDLGKRGEPSCVEVVNVAGAADHTGEAPLAGSDCVGLDDGVLATLG
jgi:hypothetical protein